jgi:hypothetical protein
MSGFDEVRMVGKQEMHALSGLCDLSMFHLEELEGQMEEWAALTETSYAYEWAKVRGVLIVMRSLISYYERLSDD